MKWIFPILLTAALLTGCQIDEPPTDSAMLGLAWYSDIGTVRSAMSAYDADEQKEITVGGEEQTWLTYDDVKLYDQPCDLTLCFTQQGLVSIVYDADEDDYNAWSSRMIKLLGDPSQDEDGRILWNDPIGDGMTDVLLTSTPDDVKDEEIRVTFFSDEA